MIAKYLTLFVISSAIGQALPFALPQPRSLVQITLQDIYSTFITNSLIPKTFGIPKFFLDNLESCHVIYPSGQLYEVFPTNELPVGPVMFLEAVQPFTSCAIGFLGADVSMSGTYELISVVHHTSEDYRSMSRQRLHLTLIESSP